MLHYNAAFPLNMRIVFILLSLFICYNFSLQIANNATSQYWQPVPRKDPYKYETFAILRCRTQWRRESTYYRWTFWKICIKQSTVLPSETNCIKVPCLALMYLYHFIAGLFSCRFLCLNLSECSVLPYLLCDKLNG